ncbi:gliding motility-associated C-terminal domain-containing protein [Bacteroidales bacterium OttesenSCG-928-B11]|nr:gliding motility-associated C-terminal domain-containing protein [Bacteroidales bacterium OttesenSCG-928-B11]MDL2325921.1 gliding motility-associated C-terminal domain-containing protein [Bacteroidales bacterium OttesenSCG-928-A14]
MSKRYICFLLLPVLVFLTCQDLWGQEISTQGTEFYATFMRNGYRGNGSDTNSKITVIASAPRTCLVTITNPSSGWSVSDTVTGGAMRTFSIPDAQGYNTNYEVVSQLGLKITATDTISLFISNEATNSFDASIVLPTHALGEKYVTQCFIPSNKSDGQHFPNSNTSCFIVIATEDSTMVDITPSKNTLGGHAANTTFSVMLNEGECYQVFSAVGETPGDLSGSIVESRECKKIAVFNGNVLTGIPAGMDAGYDHIFEQAIPVNYWGRHFVVTASLGRSGDFVKITASADETQVKVDGLLVATIDALESYSYYLASSEKANYIETSMPAAVYLYNTTSFYDNSALGDPSMIWIAPIEQQIKEIVFCTFTAQSITTHYVNIVMPTVSASTIRLNNNPLPAGSIHPVAGNPNYSYARITISNGTHHLEGDDGFFAFIYGFGGAQGYGYAVGANAIPFENDMLISQTPSAQIPEGYRYCTDKPIDFSIYSQYQFDTIIWILEGLQPFVADEFTHIFTDTGRYHLTAIVTFYNSICIPPYVDTLYHELHVIELKNEILDTACVGTNYSEYGFDFHVLRDTTASVVVGTIYDCDSVNVLHLTAHPSYYTAETVHIEIEDLPFYSHGQSYNQAGSYNIPLITDRGCDSVFSLVLIVHQDYLFKEEVVICEGEGYLFRGKKYGMPGIYYDSLKTILGDDSVYQLTLHVNPVYHITIEEDICDGDLYYFNGNSYSQTGTYIANLQTQQALCDSIVTLHLTVHDRYFMEEQVSLCPPNFYVYQGDTLCESGIHVDSLLTVNGCDSVVQLSLDFVKPSEIWLEDVICLGEPYRKEGLQIPVHEYPGVYHYEFTLADQFGCDSIVYLTLTVPDVRVSIAVTPEDFCQNYSATLHAVTPNPVIQWNTGEISASIEVAQPGIYQVVVSENDCQAKAYHQIEHCPFNIFLPNAISPGELDGYNDSFFLANANEVSELTITIYDRWGTAVFHSGDPYFRWDGTVNGKLIKNQVFSYVLILKPINGKKQKLLGTVVVL